MLIGYVGFGNGWRGGLPPMRGSAGRTGIAQGVAGAAHERPQMRDEGAAEKQGQAHFDDEDGDDIHGILPRRFR